METGITEAEIMLPKINDMTAWSCIACDQFTSEKEYWGKLSKEVSGKITTLDLILPEIYLSDNSEERIKRINANIKKYLSDGVFYTLPKGFVLTVRSTPYNKRRIGLIGAVDLDKYEYGKKTEALIRSTEGVVEERIPPRLKIRKDADVEFPHIMVLFDDEKKEICEELYNKRDTLKKLYDFDLNMGGGHIEGYFVEDYKAVLNKFSKLLDSDRLIKKYGKDDKFAFAVGDGNHSLATAKAHWNNIKATLTEEEKINHPARYALAEFTNVYDDGIVFEPIFRFVNGIDIEKFVSGIKDGDFGEIGFLFGDKSISKNGNKPLAECITKVDEYIKDFIGKNGGTVDYIHGEKNLKDLIKKNKNSVGITFNKLDKKELFTYVSCKGAFPRKTFSMGEGIEKRYYLEGKRITK